MANIRVRPSFRQEVHGVLDYGLEEFGAITVKRFYEEYERIKERLSQHPLSSRKEPLLKAFLRPYHSTKIRKNWKIIYRYDEQNDQVIFIDLWDMRKHPRTLVRQFKRKL